MNKLLVVACLVAFASVVPGVANAKGGIYVDDISITNSNASVFSDNFDDGSISDWDWIDNTATLSSAHTHSPTKSLYLNWHGKSVAEAFHKMSITQPSVVDYSAWVYLPPASEQYGWSHKTLIFTNLVLYSGNTSNNLFAGIELYPSQSAYSIWLNWNNFGGTNAKAEKKDVVAANTWVKLTLRMDNINGKAYALLNGTQQASITYDPKNFTSFNNASVWGWLGDGVAPVPEPSSAVAMLCGITAMSGFALRRKKRD